MIAILLEVYLKPQFPPKYLYSFLEHAQLNFLVFQFESLNLV